MSKQSDWKGEYTQKVISQRNRIMVTGVIQPTYGDYFGMFSIFIGVCIGVFLAIAILRPDLINWDVLMRSFMLGIIMGRH